MTNGIEVNDAVMTRRPIIVGKVIGLEETSDQHPAHIMIAYWDGPEVARFKTRVDMVTKLQHPWIRDIYNLDKL